MSEKAIRMILDKETVERAIGEWLRANLIQAEKLHGVSITKVQPSHPSHYLHVSVESKLRQTELILASYGEKKINVIKEVRAITGLGLREAKEMVEAAPTAIEPINGVEIDPHDAKRALEAAGATVELRS